MNHFPPIVRFRGWIAGFHVRRIHYGWLALTLVIGLVGAAVFLLGRLPLPWMLGPMVLAMIIALAGAPLTMPQSVRSPMLVVLGVMVGSTATPELVSSVPQWIVPLLGLVAVLGLGTLAGFLYFHRIARYDKATSYFASVPGGLTEMILLSEATGGNDRLVAMSHAVRITLVVLCVPFFVQLLSGTNLGTRPPVGIPILQLPYEQILWFAGTYLAGAFLATFINSTTALFLAPMLLSALLHGTGLTDFAIPREAGVLAQLIVGLSLGARFYGMNLRTLGGSLLWAIGACVLLVGIAFVMALLVQSISGEPLISLFLAYAPGGVAEMSLIAIALHIDVAFVVLHHLARLMLVTLFAARIFRMTGWARRSV